MSRLISVLALGLLLAVRAMPVSGQGFSGVTVTAPKVILISGESIQLEAMARDASGNPRSGDIFSFTSSNSSIVSVNPEGVATAREIGIVNLAARTGDILSPAVSLQVIPARIVVSADRSEIGIGESVQLGATAFDLNGQPLAAAFLWEVTGANGFPTRTAFISSDGLLTAVSIGLITVRAYIPYSAQSLAQLQRFDGLTYVTIRARREYLLTRVLTNSVLEGSLRLRPGFHSDFSANDRGQIAFSANIEGLGNALLLHDNNRFHVLAAAGRPGPSGGYIFHFDNAPAINNRGEVLARIGTSVGWGLIVASTESASFIPEGGSEGPFEQMGGFRVGRHSINDRGDIVFLSDFQYPDSTTRRSGLFVLRDGFIQMIWTNDNPLPSFAPPLTFDPTTFGIDRNGAVFFRVTSGANAAVYRADGISEPLRIVGTGSAIGGQTVGIVLGLTMSPGGVVAFQLGLSGNTQGVGRWRNGSLNFLPMRTTQQMLSVNDSGDVLHLGDPGVSPFFSLYRWSNQNDVQIDFAFDIEGGERPNYARAGKITAAGQVFAQLESPNNSLIVVRLDETPRTLWKAGTPVNLPVNLNFIGIVPGATNGPVHLFTGSLNSAITGLGPGGLQTLWAPGDRPFPGWTQLTMQYGAKSPNGDVYAATANGILRFSGGQVEEVLRYGIEIRSPQESLVVRNNTGWFDGSHNFAVNSTGAIAFNAITDTGNRLLLYSEGQLTTLMRLGANAPTGGVFTGLGNSPGRQNGIAIDDRGRVLVNASVNGGRSGLFLYDAGRWQPAALIGETQINGAVVSAIRGIRAAGEKFYAVIDFTSGGSILGEFDGVNWLPLVRRGDILLDATEVTFILGAFAVNRHGDVVFAASTGLMKIIVRTADGVFHVAYSEMSLTDSGDRLPFQNYEFDMRDDGRFYFMGADIKGVNTIYMAEPLF